MSLMALLGLLTATSATSAVSAPASAAEKLTAAPSPFEEMTVGDLVESMTTSFDVNATFPASVADYLNTPKLAFKSYAQTAIDSLTDITATAKGQALLSTIQSIKLPFNPKITFARALDNYEPCARKTKVWEVLQNSTATVVRWRCEAPTPFKTGDIAMDEFPEKMAQLKAMQTALKEPLLLETAFFCAKRAPGYAWSAQARRLMNYVCLKAADQSADWEAYRDQLTPQKLLADLKSARPSVFKMQDLARHLAWRNWLLYVAHLDDVQKTLIDRRYTHVPPGLDLMHPALTLTIVMDKLGETVTTEPAILQFAISYPYQAGTPEAQRGQRYDLPVGMNKWDTAKNIYQNYWLSMPSLQGMDPEDVWSLTLPDEATWKAAQTSLDDDMRKLLEKVKKDIKAQKPADKP